MPGTEARGPPSIGAIRQACAAPQVVHAIDGGVVRIADSERTRIRVDDSERRVGRGTRTHPEVMRYANVTHRCFLSMGREGRSASVTMSVQSSRSGAASAGRRVYEEFAHAR